ncbi:hypothetical protein [Sandarakinorhabdus cyanobacteriorum]|uniref:hypothetical protein n=1 Tax=Sandarakinorhabdus cyanobacteriorum TaxID=1981098 RepID=UPI0010557799|nr:hypothetical protein [Sandarakinorhabdus cyanobacteriorum]
MHNLALAIAQAECVRRVTSTRKLMDTTSSHSVMSSPMACGSPLRLAVKASICAYALWIALASSHDIIIASAPPSTVPAGLAAHIAPSKMGLEQGFQLYHERI